MVGMVLVTVGGLVILWALVRTRERVPGVQVTETSALALKMAQGAGAAGGGRAPDRHSRGQGPAPEPEDSRGSAWAVLNQPLTIQRSAWDELANRPALRQFRLGAVFGLGVGLTLAGVLYTVLPERAPAPAPPSAAAQAMTPAPGAADQPAPVTPVAPKPAAPKPAGEVSVEVAEGDLPPVVADKLRSAGVIVSEQGFLDRLVERQLDTRLRPGTFQLPTGAPVDTVIDSLTS